MAGLELAGELVKFLEDVNKDYDSGTDKKITVVEGFIPDIARASEMEKLCPRIIVRPYQITDSDRDNSGGTAEVKVVITFLTYAEVDDDAYRVIYNWMEKNRRELLAHRHLGAYWMTRPMTTAVLDEENQPRPMWAGYIEAAYQTVSIEEEGLIEDEYGYDDDI